MGDLVQRLQTLVRHGRDQGMKMNDVEDAHREITKLRSQLVSETERADLYANSTDIRTRNSTIDECARIVEARMIWWRNSSDERIRDGSENAYIARQIRKLSLPDEQST